GVPSGPRYLSLEYSNCWTLTRAERACEKNFRDQVEFCYIQRHCLPSSALAILVLLLMSSLTFSPERDRVCGKCCRSVLPDMATLPISASRLLPAIHY